MNVKTLTMTAAAAAAFALPATAMAAPLPGSVAGVTVGGSTPPKCEVSSSATMITLTDDLTNDNGRVKNSVGSKVADMLNTLNIKGWCTGNSNGLSISRSTLNNGDGLQDSAGFNHAILYDVVVNVANAVDSEGTALADGTTDGPNNGPGIGGAVQRPARRFGADGAGEAFTFRQDGQASAVTNGQVAESGSENGEFTLSNARLAAGRYTGTFTITLTPGD